MPLCGGPFKKRARERGREGEAEKKKAQLTAVNPLTPAGDSGRAIETMGT